MESGRQRAGPITVLLALAALIGPYADGTPLSQAGSAAEEIPIVEAACAEAAAAHGTTHPRVGACLMELARMYAAAGDSHKARDTAVKAIAAVRAGYPREGLGAALFRLGEIFKAVGDGGTALQYFGLAAQIYGPMDLDEPSFLATTLIEMAEIHHGESRVGEAAALLERALVLERVNGKLTTPSATSRAYQLADWYRTIGEFDKALVLLAEVAERLLAISDESHASFDDVVLQIAEMQNSVGGADVALANCRTIIERLKTNDSEQARTRKAKAFAISARIHDEQLQPAVAREEYESAIRLARGLQDDDGTLRSAFESLGFHLLRRGHYVEARARLDDALMLVEKSDGPDSVAAARLLEQIAVGLINASDTERARPIAAKAVAIYKREASQSRELIRAMQIEAMCIENDAERSKSMSEVMALQREVVGDLDPEHLLDVAREDRRRGDLRRAAAHAEAALAIEPDNATTMTVLADIYEDQRDLGRAIALAKESIRITAERYGPDSANVAARGFNLGKLLLVACDTDAASVTFLEAAATFRDHAVRLFGSLSLAEQLQLLPQQAAAQISSVLSVCADGACLSRAYERIVPWKGLMIEGLRRQADIARTIETQENAELARRWSVVRTQLAEWETARGMRPPDEWKRRNDSLAQEKEALERKLLQINPGEVGAELTLSELQQSLRDGEVFVDIYKYDYYTHEPKFRSRYGAILVRRMGAPAFVGLDAERVEAAVSAWRTAIVTDSDAPWKRVRDAVWEPIRKALPADAQAIRVSPDGELAKLPWHAFGLATPGSLRITEVDSARFFVRARRSPPRAQDERRMFLAGAIDYDAGRTAKSPGERGKPFPTLKWAATESKTIAELAASNRIPAVWLKEDQATKEVVLDRIGNSHYIHFATHAYVSGEPAIGLRGRGWSIGTAHQWSRNVLVDTGVALSGANVRDPETLTTKGTLSAEELMSSSLGSSDLVVLSACGSGLGADAEGQGLLGLRSAFVAGGARRLLLSLWNVDDKATDILMSAFYRELWSTGGSVVTALHKAQAEVRKVRRYSAPKYWAGWVVVDPE